MGSRLQEKDSFYLHLTLPPRRGYFVATSQSRSKKLKIMHTLLTSDTSIISGPPNKGGRTVVYGIPIETDEVLYYMWSISELGVQFFSFNMNANVFPTERARHTFTFSVPLAVEQDVFICGVHNAMPISLDTACYLTRRLLWSRRFDVEDLLSVVEGDRGYLTCVYCEECGYTCSSFDNPKRDRSVYLNAAAIVLNARYKAARGRTPGVGRVESAGSRSVLPLP